MLYIVRQILVNQIDILIMDDKNILKQEQPKEDVTSFQAFLRSAPVMTDEQYETFLENREMLNQWRMK